MPRDELPTLLNWVSDVLPLSYAIDAVFEVAQFAEATAAYWQNLAVVLGFAVVLLGLGAGTLRRTTPSTTVVR